MSAIQITSTLLNAWRSHQLRLQAHLSENRAPSTLPFPPPVLEDFGSVVRTLAEATSSFRIEYPGMRALAFDRSLYSMAALEAEKMEISRDYLLPLASMIASVATYNGERVVIRDTPYTGGLYIISRPPSYMALLESMEVPTSRTPRFGRSSDDIAVMTSAPILPMDWHGIPLWLGGRDSSSEIWHRLETFTPLESSTFDALSQTPNHQHPSFYDSVDRGVATTYMESRRSMYFYAPSVRPATREETTAWFSRMVEGAIYRFTDISIADVLSVIGVNSRQMSDALDGGEGRVRPIPPPPVFVSPGVATDAAVPEGHHRSPRPSLAPTFRSPSAERRSMDAATNAAIATAIGSQRVGSPAPQSIPSVPIDPWSHEAPGSLQSSYYAQAASTLYSSAAQQSILRASDNALQIDTETDPLR